MIGFQMRRIPITPWEKKQIYRKAVCIVAVASQQPPWPTWDSSPVRGPGDRTGPLPPTPAHICLSCSQKAGAWLSCALARLAEPTWGGSAEAALGGNARVSKLLRTGGLPCSLRRNK